MPKTFTILNQIILIIVMLLSVALLWIFMSGGFSILNRHQASENFSQFIALQGEDEYVIARLVSHETFSEEAFIDIMGFPIGNTDATVSLVAHYKYFIKLSELTHQLKGDVLILNVPSLYLSTPVAFEFSTVKESGNTFAFGPDKTELIEQIKARASSELSQKGRLQINTVYDKAAKALADNINSFYEANGNSGFHKEIAVIFANEKSPSQRKFSYKNSFCKGGPCKLEINLGKERVLILE